MAQEKLTMRETCEALGVSRAMVQKLEAAGEVVGEREGGRVLFDRDQVEALRTSREVAKVQRKQDTEDREFRALDVEANRQELELAAWSKTMAVKNQRDQGDRAIETLRAGIDELRVAERKRQHEASLAEIRGRGAHSATARGSELLDVATVLAPAAAVLFLAYLGRDKKSVPADAAPAEKGLQAANDAAVHTAPALTDAELVERALIEKVAARTATRQEIDELVGLMWRRLDLKVRR